MKTRKISPQTTPIAADLDRARNLLRERLKQWL
jgi:hypothetical protein